MNFVLIGLAAAVALGLLAREYYRQRRVLANVRARPGLSRGDFAAYFLEREIPTEVSNAVFDSLVGSEMTVEPGDDLSAVYEIDQELFLDSLVGLQKRSRIEKRVLEAAWKQYGNVSTVRDLVEMVALATRQQERV